MPYKKTQYQFEYPKTNEKSTKGTQSQKPSLSFSASDQAREGNKKKEITNYISLYPSQ